MSRSTQDALIFQVSACCPSSDIRENKLNVWSLTVSLRGGSDITLWTAALAPFCSTFIQETRKKRSPSNLRLDTYKCCGATRSKAFPKSASWEAFYHDYTRIDGVSGPAEIQGDWMWAEESSGNGFHPLTFSNKREDLRCIHNSGSHLQPPSTTTCCNVCLLMLKPSVGGSEGLLLNRAVWGRLVGSRWVDWDPVNGGWVWLARLSIIIKTSVRCAF